MRIYSRITTLLALAVLLASCSLFAPQTVWIDVRSLDEYNEDQQRAEDVEDAQLFQVSEQCFYCYALAAQVLQFRLRGLRTQHNNT